MDAADIYRLYFHGPAYQVLEQDMERRKPDRRADGRRFARQSSSVRSANARGAPADRALLPNCRGLGDGRERPDGLPLHIDRVILSLPRLADRGPGCTP